MATKKKNKSGPALKPKPQPPVKTGQSATLRNAMIAVVVIVAVFGVYKLSASVTQTSQPAGAFSATAPSGGSVAEGTAKLVGGVQKIDVDASRGYYNPTVVRLKAGVPAEMTFSQASGCLSSVQSSQLNFNADLTSGPQTVKIAALEPGTYGFQCGMNMVQGQVVVE